MSFEPELGAAGENRTRLSDSRDHLLTQSNSAANLKFRPSEGCVLSCWTNGRKLESYPLDQRANTGDPSEIGGEPGSRTPT